MDRRPMRYMPAPPPSERDEDYVDPDSEVEVTKYEYRNPGLWDRNMVRSRQNDVRDRRGRY